MNYIQANATYPANPDAYRSAVMMALKRLRETLEVGMDTGAFTVRQLSVSSVTDTHNAFQFAAVGDRRLQMQQEGVGSPLRQAHAGGVIPIERLGAGSRRREKSERLTATCPRRDYTMSDWGFDGRWEAARELAMLV